MWFPKKWKMKKEAKLLPISLETTSLAVTGYSEVNKMREEKDENGA